MPLLSDYLYQTRRILRDSGKRIWSDLDLTYAVNTARDRVVVDTIGLRASAPMTLFSGQEAYSFATVLAALQTIIPALPVRGVSAVLNVNYVWSSTYQPPLVRFEWNAFNLRFRSTLISSYPQAFAMYGQNQFYVQPTTPSNQQMFVDALYVPTLMVNPTDVENALIDPITALVPLMAARFATYNEQDKSRVEEYMTHYEIEKNQILAAMPPFY